MRNPADRKMEVIPMLKKSPGKVVHFLVIIAMITSAAVFGALPVHAGKSQPAPPPPPPDTADTDSDGLLDSMETGGITFSNVTGTSIYPPCSGSPTDLARNMCLATNSKDVFVFIQKLPTTGFTGNLLDGGQVNLNTLLEPVWRLPATPSPYTGTTNTGLGVAVHRLIPGSGWSNTARNIPGDTRTHPQKAIFITESADTSDPQTLGTSGVGTPNYGGGDIMIFTQRIRNQVTTACAGYTNCTDMNGANTIDGVVRNWQVHVASHEVAHSLSLRNALDPTYREHYATATRSRDAHTILEQGMYKEYPDTSTAKFYISLDFTSNEPGHWVFYIP